MQGRELQHHLGENGPGVIHVVRHGDLVDDQIRPSVYVVRRDISGLPEREHPEQLTRRRKLRLGRGRCGRNRERRHVGCDEAGRLVARPELHQPTHESLACPSSGLPLSWCRGTFVQRLDKNKTLQDAVLALTAHA